MRQARERDPVLLPGGELRALDFADDTELVGVLQRGHGQGGVLHLTVQASPLLSLGWQGRGDQLDRTKLAKHRPAVELASVCLGVILAGGERHRLGKMGKPHIQRDGFGVGFLVARIGGANNLKVIHCYSKRYATRIQRVERSSQRSSLFMFSRLPNCFQVPGRA